MRVAIVDDERLVQLGIRTYLNDAGTAFDIAGVFSNGAEALSALRQDPVDVLLTDIKMPVMDGLELITAVRAEELAGGVVVLSCHDEFALVRKAFTSGADEYVLKHEIEQNQLIDVLERLGGARRRAPPAVPTSAERGALRTAVAGFDPDCPIIACTYRFKHSYDDHCAVIPWEADRSALHALIRELLESHQPAVHTVAPSGPLLLFGLRSPDETEPHRRVRRAAGEILTAIRRYWNRELVIWVLSTPIAGAALPEFERDIQAVADELLYVPGDHVEMTDLGSGAARSTGAGSAPRETAPAQARAAWPAPPRILLGESGAPASWSEKTRAFLEEARQRRLPGNELRLAVSGMLHQIDRDLQNLIGRSIDEMTPGAGRHVTGEGLSLLARLEQFDDLTVLAQWLEAIFETVAASISREQKRRSRVGHVIAHIDRSFASHIRLQDLAQQFSMSRAYLCSRFREETGLTFTQYLNRRRIERAQELLVSTDMSAKEIAFSVGYENPNYFSRVFKSMTGRSVSEYRGTRR
jgi:AraC-like DNA-binding protein/CheY-like chemotaxis protein